jgi:hypothetical protein
VPLLTPARGRCRCVCAQYRSAGGSPVEVRVPPSNARAGCGRRRGARCPPPNAAVLSRPRRSRTRPGSPGPARRLRLADVARCVLVLRHRRRAVGASRGGHLTLALPALRSEPMGTSAAAFPHAPSTTCAPTPGGGSFAGCAGNTAKQAGAGSGAATSRGGGRPTARRSSLTPAA